MQCAIRTYVYSYSSMAATTVAVDCLPKKRAGDDRERANFGLFSQKVN